MTKHNHRLSDTPVVVIQLAMLRLHPHGHWDAVVSETVDTAGISNFRPRSDWASHLPILTSDNEAIGSWFGKT
jgi:hypothetical protein